jgi:hypothetical protein
MESDDRVLSSPSPPPLSSDVERILQVLNLQNVKSSFFKREAVSTYEQRSSTFSWEGDLDVEAVYAEKPASTSERDAQGLGRPTTLEEVHRPYIME